MGLKIKVDVKKLKGDPCETVKEALKSEPDQAYTVMGLMVTCFGVKEKEILGVPFKDMKNENAALYARIRRCLQKLLEDNKVNQGKDEQALVYWWKSDK